MSPVWMQNGRELLFYSPGRGIMGVRTRIGEELEAAPPELMIAIEVKSEGAIAHFDVSADGQLFVLAQPIAATSDEPLVVRTGWHSGLED